MKSAELILRFFAFRNDRAKYEKPLSGFLDRYSEKARTLTAAQVAEMSRQFKSIMDRVDAGLGRLAFRVFERDLKTSAQFNSALYDAEMIGFAETSNDKIINGNYVRSELQQYVRQIFDDKKFVDSISRATSDDQAVKNRIEIFLGHLDKF
jgi:hypothetical protein